MPTLHYRLTLDEPALLTSLYGEPNSSVSYPYVPGATMRGALIGALLRQGKAINPAADPDQRLFFSGATRFLNAYVVDPVKDMRTLPCPLSWVREKHLLTQSESDQALAVYDLVYGRPDGQTKGVRGFATTAGREASLVQVERRLNVHTERPRSGGGEGTVYRYDALERGQSFRGMILCAAEDATELTSLLTGMETVMLGGARSAGYGRATIDDVFLAENDSEPVIDAGPVILTLLSDAILRDAGGQVQPSLAALLYVLNLHGSSLSAADVEAYFLDTTIVGGFNRKWNLPLPQSPSLAMGSVVVLRHGTVSQAAAESWLRAGIGERREDGFGEVAVNWQRGRSIGRSKLTSWRSPSPLFWSWLTAQRSCGIASSRAEPPRLRSWNMQQSFPTSATASKAISPAQVLLA
ncbi:MAG: hypothetical protein IPK19_25080 [Chloroflexi bacterium]|nr:hypothetical protein [Chloroflexota bacterium]